MSELLDLAASTYDPVTDVKPKPLTPGVYFGLDEAAYHADPSLGSSDERRLATTPGKRREHVLIQSVTAM